MLIIILKKWVTLPTELVVVVPVFTDVSWNFTKALVIGCVALVVMGCLVDRNVNFWPPKITTKYRIKICYKN